MQDFQRIQKYNLYFYGTKHFLFRLYPQNDIENNVSYYFERKHKTMKKLVSFLAACALILTPVLASCGEKKTPDTITGSAADVLATIIEKSEYEFGMTMTDTVTADNTSYITGLTAEDFTTYVDEAAISSAMISTQAHLVVLFKAKDAAAAESVKKLVAEKYDSHRWVCVLPDESFVITSGSYVLLVSSYKESADALLKGFTAVAGTNIGEINIFYTNTEDER